MIVAKILRGILPALLALAIASAASAQAQRALRHTVPSKQKFWLDNTVFVGADFEHRGVATEVAKWLRSQGIQASNAYNKAPRRIMFLKVQAVEGAQGADAWLATVKAKRITVAFTSEKALAHAVEWLRAAIAKDPAGKRFIPGGTAADWGARHAPKDQDAMADAASALRSQEDLEAAVKKLGGGRSKEVYLVLADANRWRMESPALELAAGKANLYPADGYYSLKQLQQLMAAARKLHIEIVPTLELFAENSVFTRAFGHSVFSVEGMRLVRAAVEDCVRALKPAKICLGAMSKQADMRYMEFVSELASRLGVELVIIES